MAKMNQSQVGYFTQRAERIFKDTINRLNERLSIRRYEVTQEVLKTIGTKAVEEKIEKLVEQIRELNAQYEAVRGCQYMELRHAYRNSNDAESPIVKRRVDEILGATPEGALIQQVGEYREALFDSVNLKGSEDLTGDLAAVRTFCDSILDQQVKLTSKPSPKAIK